MVLRFEAEIQWKKGALRLVGSGREPVFDWVIRFGGEKGCNEFMWVEGGCDWSVGLRQEIRLGWLKAGFRLVGWCLVERRALIGALDREPSSDW